MNLFLLAFGVFAAAGVFLIFFGIAQSRRAPGGSAEFQTRLAQYGVEGGAGVAVAAPSAPTSLRERMNQLFQPAADAMSQRDVKRGKPSLAEKLAKADLKLRTSEFFMIQVGCVVGLLLIGFLRFGIIRIEPILMALVGYFVPGFYVKYRIGKRLKAFNNQLGDTLILLSNALKAGYSFAQAIDTVAKNAVPPISEEFGRAVREMNLGGSVEEALHNMVRRIDSADFDLVVTAVAIHRTVGGNLAEILDNIAHTIRERIRIKGEISTLTAQARASGTLITILPIGLAVFMYFVTPAYFVPMTRHPYGIAMIGAAIFLIFVGNLIIRKVVAIEV
jgi:tight adherence protein B